jgi:hypothetical protein
MENLEKTKNSFGDNDIKQDIFWNRILRKIKRQISTRLRER